MERNTTLSTPCQPLLSQNCRKALSPTSHFTPEALFVHAPNETDEHMYTEDQEMETLHWHPLSSTISYYDPQRFYCCIGSKKQKQDWHIGTSFSLEKDPFQIHRIMIPAVTGSHKLGSSMSRVSEQQHSFHRHFFFKKKAFFGYPVNSWISSLISWEGNEKEIKQIL